MTIDDRRARERAAQRQLITSTARAIAERDGWDAVTTRRLAAEIEYSQPVIYKHFASLDVLAGAVALEGFAELAAALGAARREAPPAAVAQAVARAYTAFASDNPSLYDVMFTRATALSFGVADTPTPMLEAYGELRSAVAATAGDSDVDTHTEVFWAALHGLVELERGARLRADHRTERLDALIERFRP